MIYVCEFKEIPKQQKFVQRQDNGKSQLQTSCTLYDGLVSKRNPKHIRDMFVAKTVGNEIYDFEYGNRKNNKWVGTYSTMTYDY